MMQYVGISNYLSTAASLKQPDLLQPVPEEEPLPNEELNLNFTPIVRARPKKVRPKKLTDLNAVVALNSRERKKQETRDRRLAIYQEVMALQERGFSRTEIAQKLGTNVTQVRRYCQKAFFRVQKQA
jgi:DNA-directed RNA polymerase specialized sigma24 family protein